MKNFKTILTISFLLLTAGTQVVPAQLVCRRAPQPVEIQGSLNAGDVQQAGRITRDGRPSTCMGDTAALENNTAVRRDAHNFTNPFNETVCVRVEQDFTGCGGNQTQSVAYSSYNPAFPAAGVIGDGGYSTINKGSYSFSVAPNAGFTIVVNEIMPNTGCALYRLKVSYLRDCRQSGFDRTNDGRADMTVYRPSSISQWFTLDSESQNVIGHDFGTVGDIVTGGSDYTGDGRSDLSVYRPSTSTWYHGLDQTAPGSNFQATPWGISGDRAAPGDYDGDGINDVTVWRASEGRFHVLRSTDGSYLPIPWGSSNDRMAAGDFDGDTVNDFVVVRPTASGLVWWLLKSNYGYGFDEVVHWGLSAGDKIVPGDYDGDTVTDIAVWRESNGTFYVRRSTDQSMEAFKWGTAGDIPQPADYDGDGRTDFAVWRPSNGVWYIHNSETGTYRFIPLGQQGDQPITAAYRVQ